MANSKLQNLNGGTTATPGTADYGYFVSDPVGTPADRPFIFSDVYSRMLESGGQLMTVGAVADGEYLKRSGTGLVGASAATLGTVNVYTSNDTWTKPASLDHVIVEIVGGGGGGGGVASASGQAACAGAGGGGEYAKGMFAAASLGATETVTIGGGGAGGTAGSNNGSDGGNSSFGALITAYGGKGGIGQNASATVPRTSAAAGNGGTGGSGGDVRVAGDPGFPGLNVSTTITQASIGGGNPLGGRTKDALTDNTGDTDGADGLQYGGGASGARSSNTATDYAGGDGADGVVIVWEYTAS